MPGAFALRQLKRNWIELLLQSIILLCHGAQQLFEGEQHFIGTLVKVRVSVFRPIGQVCDFLGHGVYSIGTCIQT